jgi:hypothetical protein
MVGHEPGLVAAIKEAGVPGAVEQVLPARASQYMSMARRVTVVFR